jgi:predicted ferric reductase
MTRRRGRLIRASWLVVYVVVALLPVALMLFVAHSPVPNLWIAVSLATALMALSLLVVVLVLPARMRSLLSSFGIEWVLTNHRFIASIAVLLVILHLLLVFPGDPRGLAILDLHRATRPVWAASVSTVALLALVGLALRRNRRRARYEGWRMIHVGLAVVVVVAAGLHVWWLQNLVDEAPMRAWFVALALGAIAVTVRRWVWLPLRARNRAYVVDAVRPTSGDAVTVALRALGHRGMPFRAGQFAWLKIGSSPFVFEEHPFTIASTATHPHRIEFTIKALGDFSELLIGLRPGRRVYLDGPYGGFTIEGLTSAGFVFIAGGIGITPMLSMLRTLADRGDHRSHHLLVAARTANDLHARAEVQALQSKLDLTVTEILAAPPPGWTGESGRIDEALLDRRLPRRSRHHEYFICGPPAMVIAVSQLLRQRGIRAQRIHTEQFDVA